jgi:predicted transcriptional regulator
MNDTTPIPDPPPVPVRAMKEVARAREERAFELRCRNWSQSAIAAELGISRQAVAKALQRVERRALAKLTATVGLIKARQTLQLDHLISEAYEAWEKSKKPAKKRRIKRSGKPGEGPETTKETTWRDGDPRWIGEIRSLLSAQRDIWRIGRGENESESDGESLNYGRLAEEKREEMWANLSPEDRARRLQFQADKLKAEAAALEADARTAGAGPTALPAEGDEL